MMKQALGTAVAAVFATAMAGAQAPAQSQQEGRDYQAGQQMVTVEGCLQADQIAARDDDDATFMLVNAQIQPAARAVSEAAPTDPVTGTAGEAGTQPDRPVGTTGAAETAALSATKFKVTGLDEERLEQHAGQRVQIQGEIQRAEERGVTGAERTDRPESDRPDAARPTADPTGAGTPGTAGTTGAAPHDHRTAAAGDAPKLKATSIQAVAGTCPESPAAR